MLSLSLADSLNVLDHFAETHVPLLEHFQGLFVAARAL
jgi:hypothetical protein